jgi:RHS repeat-associated protein
MTDPDMGAWSYAYDVAGLRTKTIAPSGVTTYYPFPGYEEEVNGRTTTRRITYSAAGQAIALRVQIVNGSNVLYYLHSDHLGSTSLATNTSGVKIPGSDARYYPFGDWRTEPTANLTDRGFTGHLHNNIGSGSDDIGLVYMQARWFLPTTARFISADTIIPNPANPQSYNRYAYVENQPLNFSDPTGHCKGANTATKCLVDGGPDVSVLIPGGDIINIRTPVRNPTASLGCTESLATCHEKFQLRDFEEGEHIGLLEFNQLLSLVADELHDGWTPGSVSDIDPSNSAYPVTYFLDFLAGRGRYDTPFYNGDGQALGNQVCIATHGCYGREEINYFAQGMWAAAAGDTLEEALELSEWWNQSEYSHPPTEGELFWTEFGYNWYKERYDEEDQN